ncbi:MAG TPA: hypothetical protein VGH29_15395 [Candidatus Binataceae bacterium]
MEKILSAMARLNDVAAINELLAPMRDRAALKRKLRPGFRGHKYVYDRRMRTARYLLTNGEFVACYSVTDVSLEQAAMIATACDEISEWSMTTFQAAVDRVLGGEFGRTH